MIGYSCPLYAHVLVKLIEGYYLMLLLVEFFLNVGDNVAALPFAFSSDLLDVFWVDTDTFHGLFYIAFSY
jgi:hypothetical protein